MTNPDITIRALNPDNQVEVQQLIGLFMRLYGENYPLRSVYDPKYWQTHVGQRFFSVVAWRNGEAVAHLALHPEREGSSNVQLSFALIDPNYEDIYHEVRSGFRSVLESQIARQRWTALFHYQFGVATLGDDLIRDLMRGREVAICPAYLPSNLCTTAGNPHGCNVSIALKTYNQDLLETRTIFVPDAHLEFCREVYQTISLERIMKRSADSKHKYAISADCAGITIKSYTTSGVCNGFIEPSLLPNMQSAVTELKEHRARAVYGFINLEDPKAPQCCEQLEERGFRFSGMLPLWQGRDWMVYWREAPAVIAADINYATPLARYILGAKSPAKVLKLPKMAETRLPKQRAVAR